MERGRVDDVRAVEGQLWTVGARTGSEPDDLQTRLLAAGLNAALRVVTEELAWSAAEEGAVGRHREQLADALRRITGQPSVT